MILYIKRTIASVLFVVGLLGLLIGTSYVFTPKNGEMEFGVEDPEANAIQGEQKNSVDVLVFGDSESYSNIVPMQVWKQVGIPMFICGTRAQRLDYTQILLQRAFRTQSPKVVVLETNTLFRDVSAGTKMLSQVSNYISIFSNHNRWKTFGSSAKTVEKSNIYKGYAYNSKVDPAPKQEYMVYTEEVAEIFEINVDYVKEIKAYCESNGAELVFVSTPSAKNWNYKRHNAVTQLADRLGCKYVDLNLHNDEIGIDWKTDTRDRGDHLNHRGAVKATRYLADYLNNLGICVDRRNDPAYTSWNESLSQYEFYTSQNDQ